MTVAMKLKAVFAAALFGIAAVAAVAPADAKPRTCTNNEIRTIVSDYLVIACINRGGSIKCDGGVGLCCKNDVCVDASNINHLSNDPGPRRPPHVRTDPGPGRVSPPQNPVRPPRADPPPSRVSPPSSGGGPRVK